MTCSSACSDDLYINNVHEIICPCSLSLFNIYSVSSYHTGEGSIKTSADIYSFGVCALEVQCYIHVLCTCIVPHVHMCSCTYTKGTSYTPGGRKYRPCYPLHGFLERCRDLTNHDDSWVVKGCPQQLQSWSLSYGSLVSPLCKN